jgi:hypothetical protein
MALETEEVFIGKVKDALLRSGIYGKPIDNFNVIACLLNAYFGEDLSRNLDERDVAVLMILFKVARLRKSDHPDNMVDIAGYAACLYDILMSD